jgi:hypothetical protein
MINTHVRVTNYLEKEFSKVGFIGATLVAIDGIEQLFKNMHLDGDEKGGIVLNFVDIYGADVGLHIDGDGKFVGVVGSQPAAKASAKEKK